MDNKKKHSRIVKNSLFLYFRMILTLAVTLYTSRVVLNVLGVEDFGIYNVVGGVVTMMAFLSGAMSSATQRFLSFELGKGDKNQLANVFKMSVNIHVLIIFIVVFLGETAGLWFINTKLTIPAERILVANWVYHCALFSFCCSILSVPYNALIIANEKMSAFAYISIIDVTLKLMVVFLLPKLAGDPLEYYAQLLALVSLIITFSYYIYAKKRIAESCYSWYWDPILFKTLFSYTGWNLFGNLASVITNQGVNILLNIFFGATVNAARAIAYQVNSAVMGFVSSLQMAINPQIIKSYANENYQYMLQLVFAGARYSFFLLYILAVPFLLKTESVLGLWLGIVPKYASEFCRLVVIDSLIISISGTLMTAFQATGNIRRYQVVVGLLIMCNLPCSYILLKNGFDANVTMLVSIFISLVAFLCRVILLSKIFPEIAYNTYNLICRVGLVFLPSIVLLYKVPILDNSLFWDLVYSCTIYWLVIIICILVFGIDRKEQQFLSYRLNRFYQVGRKDE
ncbi:MATE family efflux transporter [Aeromonas media]|uniref:lipopolysaccharide biosynthesis protein n=1 Tax=Aeromonas media TaxID=651 RepID=UPI0038CF4E1A